MSKEKRFIEDYNEDNESEEELELNLPISKNPPISEEPEEDLESEIEEDVQNIFEDNFGDFSPSFRARASSISPSLESEPIQNQTSNLERNLENVPAETAKNENTETPMMYNAPQYSGGASYDAVGYESMQNTERTDITGGASTANLGREINMKRWQETAMGYPRQASGGQGEQYIRAPEKQREERGLPFERGNQRRNIGWKEEY